MPAISKCSRLLGKTANFHVQSKWAHNLCMAIQFLDDLPSSDAPVNTNMFKSLSPSSLSSASSPSFGISDSSSSPSCHSTETHLGHSSSSSDNFDSLESMLLERCN